VGWASTGELWPSSSGRTLWLWCTTALEGDAQTGGACTPCTHMHVQLVDLQQSGLVCLGSALGEAGASAPDSTMPVAWWQGFSIAVVSGAGAVLIEAAWDICMRVAANAPVAPLSTKATLRTTRKRMDRAVMSQL